MLITEHSNLISHYLSVEGDDAEVTDNAISIVNNSVAEMKHTNISAFFKKEHCLFTITGESKMTIASMYSMNNNSDINNRTTEGKHMVCIDSSSQASGLETGEYYLYFLIHVSCAMPGICCSKCHEEENKNHGLMVMSI